MSYININIDQLYLNIFYEFIFYINMIFISTIDINKHINIYKINK